MSSGSNFALAAEFINDGPVIIEFWSTMSGEIIGTVSGLANGGIIIQAPGSTSDIAFIVISQEQK